MVPGGSAAGARHEMVRITRFEPDRAAELLDKARRKWVDANRTRYAVDKCEYLQRSMEHALKALITADGRRIEHTHELDALWEQAQGTGERISATRNPPAAREAEPVRRRLALRDPGRREPGSDLAGEPDDGRGRPEPRAATRSAADQAPGAPHGLRNRRGGRPASPNAHQVHAATGPTGRTDRRPSRERQERPVGSTPARPSRPCNTHSRGASGSVQPIS